MFPTAHLHPMLVHFPIAIISVGFLFELISLFYKKEVCMSKSGFYLLVLGALFALAALLSGALFTSEMSGAAGEVRDIHELFAYITLISVLINAAFRIFLKIKNREEQKYLNISFALYLISALSVSITGFYGGNLVYNYMMPI